MTPEEIKYCHQQIIARAAELPLWDGAHEIWRLKGSLDRYEGTHVPQHPPRDLNDPAIFKTVVREALTLVACETATAHIGPTFDRLKLAHPEASDRELQRAVKAAVNLSRDCLRHYTALEGNWDNIQKAVELARLDNPGFLEQTYQSAENDLRRAMR